MRPNFVMTLDWQYQPLKLKKSIIGRRGRNYISWVMVTLINCVAGQCQGQGQDRLMVMVSEEIHCLSLVRAVRGAKTESD